MISPQKSEQGRAAFSSISIGAKYLMTEWSRVHATSNRLEVDITRALLANTSSHPAAAMAFAVMVNGPFVGHVDLDGASRLAVGADSPDGLNKRIDVNVGADHRSALP
jgi:hypothetical protein